VSDAFEIKIVVTRGTGSNDKEKMTMKVTAPNIEELSDRVDEVREQMEDWADDFRAIDPDRGRQLGDDQSRLGGEA